MYVVRVVDRVQEAAAELLLGSKQITLVGGLVQAGGRPCYWRHLLWQCVATHMHGAVLCRAWMLRWIGEVVHWMLRGHTGFVH